MQRVLFITNTLTDTSFQKWRAAAKKHIKHACLTLKWAWKSSKNHCRHRLQSPWSWICFWSAPAELVLVAVVVVPCVVSLVVVVVGVAVVLLPVVVAGVVVAS